MTLRRPATSHQRSATLQHRLSPEDLPPQPSKFSFDRPGRPRAKTVETRQQDHDTGLVKNERSRWKSFWHMRLSKPASKTTSLRTSDGGGSLNRRVRLSQHYAHLVYLIPPNKVTMDDSLETVMDLPEESEPLPCADSEVSPRTREKKPDSNEGTPSKQPKRSLSMQFGSPSSWISKTSSLRLRKRGEETTGGKRHTSAPMTDDGDQTQNSKSTTPNKTGQGAGFSQAEADFAAMFCPPGSRSGPQSPIPPLSRLSSFHLEMNRLGSPSPTSTDQLDEGRVSPSVSSRVHSHASQTRTLERASTVGSSEYYRGFTSGDDDDTDFKTDTPFDSFRTGASDRKRALDGPLELIFDDSPPSTAGNNSKPKRLSIQEILGPSFDGGSRIMEEEENAPTPVRGTYEEFEARFRAASIRGGDKFVQASRSLNVPVDESYNRLSLDDDDDSGWAKEDETEFYNHLSPPSSMNSRRGSPKSRAASGRGGRNPRPDVHSDPASKRPRSTVFDWTEPPAHDKRERNGHVHRPNTVHGKHEMDLRGGRTASRKGFIPVHVRSQSVPVVNDPVETKKPVPKFGTWGRHKNVSEDWDDDFEFDEDTQAATSPAGKKNENGFTMLVPLSIQATQPTVKAHSGQIRELSLLVNDLKRLCRLGREMKMVVSPSAKLWHEAEGIIALASPDEDTEDTGVTEAEGVDHFDVNLSDERRTGKSPDTASIVSREGSWHQNSPPSRRRSVFSPDDDIFGTWDHVNTVAERPDSPDRHSRGQYSKTVARSVIESIRRRHTISDDDDDDNDVDEDDNTNNQSQRKVNFDTNSLKELVKRAGDLRDRLSELVRREDHITQSPARTPKHTRSDGSPAFTRVFDDPTSSPTRRLSPNHNRPVRNTSVSTSPSNGISRRMHMMLVS